MKATKKKAKSVLYSQNKVDFFIKNKLFFVIVSSYLSSFLLFSYFQNRIYNSIVSLWKHNALRSEKDHLKPDLDLKVYYPLTSPHSLGLAMIGNQIERLMRYDGIESFDKYSKIALNYGFLDKISSKQIGLKKYIIQLTPKEPYLCIQMETTRFVTEKGHIYGQAYDRNQCPNYLVNGIFESKETSNINMSSNRSLVVSEDKSAIILEAIELKKSLQATSFQIKKDLNFDKSRGFTIYLSTPPIEVVLGRAPFQVKLTRLSKIKLQNAELHIEKIELDYKEKAFIKYAKPSS